MNNPDTRIEQKHYKKAQDSTKEPEVQKKIRRKKKRVDSGLMVLQMSMLMRGSNAESLRHNL